MDADLQDSPDEIPELYRMITQDRYDLVSGWKQKRYDPLSKTIPTKLFNATARKVSGIRNLHDFNCGLKAYRNKVVKRIEVYGDMHRYVPYLAKNAGFNRIGEKVVHHQARKYGTTKFGLDRFVNGYLDLATLWFTSRFGIKPMHFFGLLGSLMFFLGLIAVAVVGFTKLYDMHHGNHYILVTDSPYFYLALTAMLLGAQLFLTGFIGELIVRNSDRRKVPEDLLVAILDIVRLAPSACNKQPWRFLVIDDAAQSEVLRKSYSREWFDNAPVYIVALGTHDEAWHRGFDGKDHTDVDVAIAVEHLCLAATSVGLGTCWVCNFDLAIVKDGLQLPDNVEPIAIIPIGYPVDGETVPEKKRKALDDIVKWGKF